MPGVVGRPCSRAERGREALLKGLEALPKLWEWLGGTFVGSEGNPGGQEVVGRPS